MSRTASTGTLFADSPTLPWVYEVAACVENEPVQKLYTDAGTLHRCLANATDLFGLPAVCISFDTTLEAEAAGCTVQLHRDGDRAPTITDGAIHSVQDAFDIPITSIADNGRIPVILDAANRLNHSVTVPIFGGVTGPGTLTEKLLGDGRLPDDVREEAAFVAGDICVEMTNAYVDRGVGGIAILEPDGLESRNSYRKALEPLCNVIEYYDMPTVLVTRTMTPDDVRLAADLRFDAITGRLDPECSPQEVTTEDIHVGIGIPRSTFRDGLDAVQAFRRTVPETAFLSSEWTVPAEIPPEILHTMMDWE